MRRVLVSMLAIAALVACAPQKKAEVEVDLRKNLSPGCYTVDLFDPYQIEYPQAGVSPENARFLGVWKNGAWGGNWCHDLYITNVAADGTVTLLDAHGPSVDRGAEATVFRRKGRIENGELIFLSYGSVPVRYKLVGDFLVGVRKSKLGTFEITMSREDGIALVPIPRVKPTRSS